MKKFKPPTKQEMIDYAKSRNLNVDADWLWEYWKEGDWHKANGDPIRNWKQTMLVHHKCNEGKRIKYYCRECKKSPAPYVDGADRDGHPCHYCHTHKPQRPMPQQIQEMAKGLLKGVSNPNIDLNEARNRNRKALGI